VRSIEESASMPITEDQAEAALDAIRSGKAFAACQGNQHLFSASDHTSKNNALEAVKSGAAQKGYFKQYIEKDVYKEFKRKKRVIRSHQGTRQGTRTLPNGTTDIFNIVNMALEASDYELYAGQKDDRFVFRTSIPRGYAGRAMRAGNPEPIKEKEGIDQIAIVIRVGIGSNASVITAFPVPASYFNAMTPL